MSFTLTNIKVVKREKLLKIERFWKNKIAEHKLVGNIFSDNQKNNSNYDPDKIFQIRIIIRFSLTVL